MLHDIDMTWLLTWPDVTISRRISYAVAHKCSEWCRHLSTSARHPCVGPSWGWLSISPSFQAWQLLPEGSPNSVWIVKLSSCITYERVSVSVCHWKGDPWGKFSDAVAAINLKLSSLRSLLASTPAQLFICKLLGFSGSQQWQASKRSSVPRSTCCFRDIAVHFQKFGSVGWRTRWKHARVSTCSGRSPYMLTLLHYVLRIAAVCRHSTSASLWNPCPAIFNRDTPRIP